jgi:hypothetical protein
MHELIGTWWLELMFNGSKARGIVIPRSKKQELNLVI